MALAGPAVTWEAEGSADDRPWCAPYTTVFPGKIIYSE